MEELKKQLSECELLWSKYSCDCLYFEIVFLKKEISKLSQF